MTDNRLHTRVRKATHNAGGFYFSTRNQSFYLTLQRVQHRPTTMKHNTQSPPVTFSAVSYTDCVYICKDRCYIYACCSMFYRPLPTLSPFLIGHLAYVDVKHQESKILSFCSSCHTHSTARVKQEHEFHIFCSYLFYIRKHRQSKCVCV